MRRKEIELRKELAVMHLRVARAELALARATRPNDALATVAPLISSLSTVFENRRFGRWGKYVRFALRVARLVVGVRRGL